MSTIGDIISDHKAAIETTIINMVVGLLAKVIEKLIQKHQDAPTALKKLIQTHQNLLDKVQPTQEVSTINVPVAQPRNVTFIQSPNFSSRNGDTIKAIILHDTESRSAESAISWFQDKTSQVSAHYVIAKDGNITQMVKEADKAWHCGVSSLHARQNVNTFSIGIELVGDGKTEFTRDQYEALAWLVKMLKKKYDIEDDWIAGHKDIALPLGRKVDPSPFNWDLFWVLVRQK